MIPILSYIAMISAVMEMMDPMIYDNYCIALYSHISSHITINHDMIKVTARSHWGVVECNGVQILSASAC